MTDSTTKATVSQTALDVLLLAVRGAKAQDTIATCARIVHNHEHRSVDRALARAVMFDATVMLAEARETLVDMGADRTAAVAAMLDTDRLDADADELAAHGRRFLARAGDQF